MKTNIEVIKLFLMHRPGSSNNLHSTGTKLFSYKTCIAEYLPDVNSTIINFTKYSSTTTRHLNLLLNNNIVHLPILPIRKGLPRGVTSLINYLNTDLYGE